MELVVFILAAAMVLVGAVGVVVRRNPVHAALSMVLTLFGIAVLFVALNAHFLAAVQVIVYAGAIVVLFLFVIMLLGVDEAEDLAVEPIAGQRPLAIIVSGGVVALIVSAIVASRTILGQHGSGLATTTVDNPDANVQAVARSLFANHVFAFEVTSVLLLIAVVGTVVMARRLRADDGAGK
jgi:NADH-quinone oxidoreductase subunit J